MIQTTRERAVGSTRVLMLGLLLAALVSLMLAAMPAHAAKTFTVSFAAFDAPDLSIALNGTSDGVCDADFDPGQQCTLRAAIQEANETPGADLIRFEIDGSGATGVKTIEPTSELPTIIEQVTIDGYSQPGARPNTLEAGTNANLLVELDGSGVPSDPVSPAAGLVFGGVSDNSVVKGLVVNRFADDGIVVGAGKSGVRIEGNFIGTDPSGTIDRGNGDDGVFASIVSDSIVGGSTPGKRNLISGNGDVGVNVFAGKDNRVIGNLIGTKKDGKGNLGNTGDGVVVKGDLDNTVGGTSPGTANTIAHNGGDGVEITDTFDSSGNRILSNSIFANIDLGIDLEGGTENAAGATANDPGDTDEGVNGLQNKPVLTSATTAGSKTTIRARLNSTPNATFRVEFFSNPGSNEGKKILGAKSVSTNASGDVIFTFTPTQAVAVGQTVTATATNSVSGDTSEFSASRSVVR